MNYHIQISRPNIQMLANIKQFFYIILMSRRNKKTDYYNRSISNVGCWLLATPQDIL